MTKVKRSKVKRSKVKIVKRTMRRGLKRRPYNKIKKTKLTNRTKIMKGGMESRPTVSASDDQPIAVLIDTLYPPSKNQEEVVRYINVSEQMSRKLEELNHKIKLKCPQLSLVLGKHDELKGEITTYDMASLHDQYLILCLYHNENCISSIELRLGLQKQVICVFINSRTKEEFSGRKYNKLLRAVVIILLENETNTQGFIIGAIKSTADNPISALLLIRDYDTDVLHNGFPKVERPLSYGDFMEMGMKKDGTGGSLNIRVPLTESNIKKAYAILDLLLDTDNISSNITCS